MENDEQKKTNLDGNKRVFAGSWVLVIAPVFVTFLRVWYNISKLRMAGNEESTFTLLFTEWHILEIIIWTIGGAILYYFASRVPIRVLIARAKKRGDNESGIGSFFEDSFKGGTVKYDIYDQSGSFQRSEEYYVPGIFVGLVEVPLKLLLVILFIFVKAALVPYWALFNFIRNYLLLWLFPKKFTYV